MGGAKGAYLDVLVVGQGVILRHTGRQIEAIVQSWGIENDKSRQGEFLATSEAQGEDCRQVRSRRAPS